MMRDEVSEEVEYVVWIDWPTSAYRFYSLERPATREHRETCEEPLLGLA